jgi:hypothetical protein
MAAPAALAALPGPESLAPASIDWTEGDCLSRLRTLQQAVRDGRLTTGRAGGGAATAGSRGHAFPETASGLD